MSKTRSAVGHWLSVGGVLFVGVWSAAVVPGGADTTSGDLARGAQAWSENCARCHNMRNPTEFRDDLWRPIVTHMRVRAGLTGQQQRDILAFLQASNNPASVRVSSPSEAAEGGEASAISGKTVYHQTCVTCHGANGKGVFPGVPNFGAKDGPLSKPDEVLLRHIIEGFQSPGSPMAMPPKGSNPDLTQSDIRNVLQYIRDTFGP